MIDPPYPSHATLNPDTVHWIDSDILLSALDDGSIAEGGLDPEVANPSQMSACETYFTPRSFMADIRGRH